MTATIQVYSGAQRIAVRVKNINIPLKTPGGDGDENRSGPCTRYVNAPDIKRAKYGSDRQR
jgi:hypothetical protein